MNAIPITPETPPQFPCWLLTRIISGDPKIWCRAKTNPGGLALSYCSHWHPDQPEAPTSPPTPSVMDKLTEETERLGLYDTVVPPPAPLPQTTEEEIDFIKYRFPSREAYQQWCEDMVTKIYYAQIAMNDTKIRGAVAEIGMKLWLQEGVELYGSPTPQESPVGREGEDKRRLDWLDKNPTYSVGRIINIPENPDPMPFAFKYGLGSRAKTIPFRGSVRHAIDAAMAGSAKAHDPFPPLPDYMRDAPLADVCKHHVPKGYYCKDCAVLQQTPDKH